MMLIAPPTTANLTKLGAMFEGAAEKSQEFAVHYRRTAEWNGCAFVDAGKVVQSSDKDGIHLEAYQHANLAGAVLGEIRQLVR